MMHCSKPCQPYHNVGQFTLWIFRRKTTVISRKQRWQCYISVLFHMCEPLFFNVLKTLKQLWYTETICFTFFFQFYSMLCEPLNLWSGRNSTLGPVLYWRPRTALLYNTCLLHAARIPPSCQPLANVPADLNVMSLVNHSTVCLGCHRPYPPVRFTCVMLVHGAIEGHFCSLIPLQMTVEIRCLTVQYKMIIKIDFL